MIELGKRWERREKIEYRASSIPGSIGDVVGSLLGQRRKHKKSDEEQIK